MLSLGLILHFDSVFSRLLPCRWVKADSRQGSVHNCSVLNGTVRIRSAEIALFFLTLLAMVFYFVKRTICINQPLSYKDPATKCSLSQHRELKTVYPTRLANLF